MLTIHKTYEGELRAKKEAVYVADGEAVKKVKGAQLSKFYEGVVVGSSLLSTSSNPKDVSIIDLLGRGIQVYRAHWHSTGIPKGLEPEEIALRFSQLPESQLQLMRLRPEILQLGQMVAIRQAFVEHRKADVLRLGAIRRAAGIADGEELPPDLKKLEQEINTDERKFEIPIDKKIAKMASEIPECQLFSKIADLKAGMMTAAVVMSEIVDVSRFPQVASLWHYAGEHVVDGQAPKRAKGASIDWNPKLRTAMWNLSVSIIRNRSNRWRAEYENFLQAETAVHAQKHPNCPSPQGHCGARARRRIRKEILKEFWLACQTAVETQGMDNVS